MDPIPTVPRAEELKDWAFRKASKIDVKKGSAEADTKKKINSVITYVGGRLNKVVKSFPTFERLHPFYRELFDLMFGLDRARKSLGAVQWAKDNVQALGPLARQRLKAGDNPDKVRKMVYGRVSSIVDRVSDDLLFLDEIRNVMKKTPELDTESPTLVICGYPNVGKSTLLRRLTRAEPEVAHYPFTTKKIHLGHLMVGRIRVQVMDTPGLFDRSVESMNPIERQGIAALRHIADAALVVMDPTETCGFEWESQMNLLEMLDGSFDLPTIIVENKADQDLFTSRLEDSTPFSALSAADDDVAGLVSMLSELMQKGPRWGEKPPSSTRGRPPRARDK
jgi:nucleolar GTP-binding protein